MGGLVLTICTSCGVFLQKKLTFRGGSDCTCVRIFSGINFLIAINSLMRLFDRPAVKAVQRDKGVYQCVKDSVACCHMLVTVVWMSMRVAQLPTGLLFLILSHCSTLFDQIFCFCGYIIWQHYFISLYAEMRNRLVNDMCIDHWGINVLSYFVVIVFKLFSILNSVTLEFLFLTNM